MTSTFQTFPLVSVFIIDVHNILESRVFSRRVQSIANHGCVSVVRLQTLRLNELEYTSSVYCVRSRLIERSSGGSPVVLVWSRCRSKYTALWATSAPLFMGKYVHGRLLIPHATWGVRQLSTIPVCVCVPFESTGLFSADTLITKWLWFYTYTRNHILPAS